MKLRTRALALLMSVLMALTSPMQALAEGESANQAGDYLEDVYVAVAKTADEAAKALEADGYTVLKADDGKPADLNQGANSALKEDRAVVLGYKTTDDRANAVTDLAVMNMNGGYSVVDYQALMDTYRDSQIKPFIERFMATVQEYRANNNSTNHGNKAKADYAHAMLNRIKDDDTGWLLGDLLLRQTKAELGDAYDSLPIANKAQYIDLETALMQGNAELVYLVEQLLGSAADTDDRTWLERLSSMGPNGLEGSYGDMRPTDVQQDMDSKYQEVAKQLAQDWESMRAELLTYDAEVAGTQEQTNDEENTGEQADEVAVEELVHMDVEVPNREEGKEVTVEDVPEVIGQFSESLGAMGDTAGGVASTRVAGIYTFLKSSPYGEGTLYDLFTKPSEEVTGENISVLYPAASCLSAGQVAALEFLPLERLLQIGSTTNEAFAEAWSTATGLMDVPELVDEVSLYQGVYREIFSEQTALTSDALRAQALQREDTGVIDFLAKYKVTALLWAGTVVSALLAGASAYRYAKLDVPAKLAMAKRLGNTQYDLNRMMSKLGDGIDNFKIDYSDNMVVYKATNETGTEVLRAKISGYTPKSLLAPEEVTELSNLRTEVLTAEKSRTTLSQDKMNRYEDLLAKETNQEAYSEVKDFTLDSGLSEDMDNYSDAIDDLERQERNTLKPVETWGTARAVFTVATVLLLIASIAFTISDIVAYYNAEYAPIPRFIVDERDVTAVAADGSKRFVRNDTAYYQVVASNAQRYEDWLSMKNYADLNGDKGKEWLALYALRDANEPILASSLKVVTGTSSVPDGYSTGVHMFGSDTAFNLTDARYCYNDDANGVYAYFRRDESAVAAASAFSGGTAALAAGVGLVAGAAIGAGGMYLACGRRREPAEA